MAVVEPSPPVAPVSGSSLLAWTIATAVVQTIFLLGLLAPDDALSAGAGITVGFFGSFVVAWAVSRRRWLGAGLAGTAIAAIWPLAVGRLRDDELPGSFAAVVVVFVALVLVCAGTRLATRRGWIAVQTPARQRAAFAVALISGVMRMVGMPAGVWNRPLGLATIVILAVLVFWPARKPRPAPDHTATA